MKRKISLCLLAAGVVGAVTSLSFPSWAQYKRPYKEITKASWYGGQFHGRLTASGTRFNKDHLTAAHRSLEIGSRIKVTALHTGKSVIVEITDRGPYVRGRGIDLSYAAAAKLGIVNQGVAPVRLEMVAPAIETRSAPVVIAATSGGSAAWPRAIVR